MIRIATGAFRNEMMQLLIETRTFLFRYIPLGRRTASEVQIWQKTIFRRFAATSMSLVV